MKEHDIAGQIFGRWTAAHSIPKTRPKLWSCVCSCGNQKIVRKDHLKKGLTQSCGCLHAERAAERARAGVLHKNMDGRSALPEYSVYQSMVQRCTNPKSTHFKHYGGRGIGVCPEWRADFAAFYADMGARPPGGTLDRVNNLLGYAPGNCRWATRKEQANNTRQNVWVEGKTLAQWAEFLGIPDKRLRSRYEDGMRPPKLFETELPADVSGLALGGAANSARQKAKTHCPSGHAYDQINTYFFRGWRSCRACKCAREAARRARYPTP